MLDLLCFCCNEVISEYGNRENIVRDFVKVLENVV